MNLRPALAATAKSWRMALGYPVQLVADGHSTVDNSVLSAQQISAHHNATLANLSSFGSRTRAVPAAQVEFN